MSIDMVMKSEMGYRADRVRNGVRRPRALARVRRGAPATTSTPTRPTA